MQRAEVLQTVEGIIRDQLNDPSISVGEQTMVDDIPDWDSVAHIQIIVAIENRFSILCDPEEYMSFVNVGEMVDSICHKLENELHAEAAVGPEV